MRRFFYFLFCRVFLSVYMVLQVKFRASTRQLFVMTTPVLDGKGLLMYALSPVKQEMVDNRQMWNSFVDVLGKWRELSCLSYPLKSPLRLLPPPRGAPMSL